VYTTDHLEEKQAPSETTRGPSGLRREPSGRWGTEKSEGNGFGKMNFSVLADRPGCTTGPSATAFIWHLTTHLMHYSLDIAVTADRCDFSRWCTGADRPDQGRGPSAVGRIGATARKWLVAINTTPTTSIHNIQAFQSSTFNTRASNPFQDTIKASNLSKFHNWDKWSLVISDLRESDSCVICRSCRLDFAIVLFFFPILILKTLVIKARDTKL
jgi:hypothetical protein